MEVCQQSQVVSWTHTHVHGVYDLFPRESTSNIWSCTRVANSVAYDVSPLRAVSEQSTVKDPTSM